jgi:hypothetical protein
MLGVCRGVPTETTQQQQSKKKIEDCFGERRAGCMRKTMELHGTQLTKNRAQRYDD